MKAGHFPGNTSGGRFWPQGHNFNKLGRSPVDDATYQISMLLALKFQTRRFFMFPIYKPTCICKTCDAGGGGGGGGEEVTFGKRGKYEQTWYKSTR